jgi:hypothetical protein
MCRTLRRVGIRALARWSVFGSVRVPTHAAGAHTLPLFWRHSAGVDLRLHTFRRFYLGARRRGPKMQHAAKALHFFKR